MKKTIKDCKKGGFAGAKARFRLKTMLIASGIMLIMGVMCFLSGSIGGMVAGAALAFAPIAGFVLPEGVEFTEAEKKGLSALANHFTKQFDEFAKGKMSKEEVMESMSDTIKEWAEKSGLSAEKMQKIEEALKEQGKVLTSLKERANTTPGMKGLKAQFFKQYDDLKKAIKEKKAGYSIKAIDEHDPDLIETTDNIIATTTGAQLTESIVNDPNLYLKRRDRQYIHDIANTTVVNEVPEVYTFFEEGDEEGAIAIVAENGLKPQVHLDLIKNQVEAKKAAGYIVVTEEVIKWRARAWAAIKRLFSDKVYRDYENLLTTDLIGNATQYVGTPLDGTIANPTDFDAIIAAILQLEMLNFSPNVLVINPADKWRLAMTTTPNGMFILPYIQQGGEFGLLGLRVITTNKMAAGTFLLGESGTWFIEEERPQLRTGLVNDDLIHNRMTIVGEIFFLSYIPSNNAGSFIMATFADVKEALATV